MTSTETKWRARVSEWHESGQRAEGFAEGKGFKPSTLRWWAGQLRRGVQAAGRSSGEARTVTGVAMARVIRRAAPGAAANESTVTIAMGAVRIVVGPGFDPDLLRQVVGAIGGDP